MSRSMNEHEFIATHPSRRVFHTLLRVNGILLSLSLFFTLAFADNQEMYPFAKANQAKQFTNLTQEIRCLVCQNQSIADSNAPLAEDLRRKVYRMIQENKTDDEIKNYLTKRYGEFILLQPRFNKVTFFLWLFPFFALGMVGFLLYRHFGVKDKG